jgi:hypothetical protein
MVFGSSMLCTHTKADGLFWGRARYQNFPLLYYGIGFNTAPHPLATVNARQLHIKQRVLRKLQKTCLQALKPNIKGCRP